MLEQFKKLEKVAKAIAEADPNVIEVIIHQDRPQPPLTADEVYLVCHLNHYGMTSDMNVYEDESFDWTAEVSENVSGVIEKLGLSDKDIIITPFNFELHRQNEYGEYFRTLFIKPGFEPVLTVADRELKKKNQDFDEEIVAYETDQSSEQEEKENEYTISQVEQMTGINKQTLQSYVKTGKVQGYKKSNRWVIPESEIRKFQGADTTA